MIETLKWKIIELLIRYRVLAPCYVRTDRRRNQKINRPNIQAHNKRCESAIAFSHLFSFSFRA